MFLRGWAGVLSTAAVAALAALLGYLVVRHTSIAATLAVAGVLCGMLPFFAPMRRNVERNRSTPIAPELLLLPLIVEGRIFTGNALAAIFLIALIAYAASLRATNRPASLGVVALVVVAFFIPYFRLVLSGSLGAVLLPVLAISLLAMASRRRGYQTYVTSLVDGVGLYLLLNVSMHFAGLSSPTASFRTGGLESLGGGIRVIFPIATSLSAPAAMAAVFVAGSAICLERSSWRRTLFRVAALGAAVFVLVAASTRAAMLVAAVLLVASIVSTRLLARLAPIASAASVGFAFFFVSVQSIVGAALSGLIAVVPQFSRGGVSSDVTLNFRSTIWSRTLDFWTGSVESVEKIFGFGILGQQRSGASALYAQDVAWVSSEPRSASLHNSYLQQLYDAGIVGLLVLGFLVVWVSRRHSSALRRRVPGAQVALPAVLAAVFTGITEVTVAPGYGLGPAYVLVGLAICSRPPGREESRKVGLQSSSGAKRSLNEVQTSSGSARQAGTA